MCKKDENVTHPSVFQQIAEMPDKATRKTAAKRTRRSKGATIVHVSTITGMHRVKDNSAGKRFVLCSTNDDKNVWVQRASIVDLNNSLSRSLVFSEAHNQWPSMRGGRPSALPESPNEGAVAYHDETGESDDNSSSPARYKERIQRLEEQVDRLERRLCDDARSDAPTTILVDFMRRLEEKVDAMIPKGASTFHYTPTVMPSYQPTTTCTAQESPMFASMPQSVFGLETDAENQSNAAIHSQDSYGFDEALMRSASILSCGSTSV